MTTQKIIGLSFIGLMAWYFLRLKNTTDHLNFFVAGAGLKMDGSVPVLRLDLGVQNPDQNGFTLRSVVGNLSSNGYQIANVASFTPKYIAPLSQSVYPLYFRLSLINIVSDIVNIFTGGGGFQQKVEFSGTVAVDNITSPLELNYLIG